MTLQNLMRTITTAREHMATLAADRTIDAGARRKVIEIHGNLDEAMRYLAGLNGDLFELQEQNQQLRRDLAAKVCSRLCARGYRTAS
jgi:hypothetical protein